MIILKGIASIIGFILFLYFYMKSKGLDKQIYGEKKRSDTDRDITSF